MASRTHLTDEEVREALKTYVQLRLDIKAFAHILDVSEATARSLLKGRSWRHIHRPAGFQYPWPEHGRVIRRRTEEEVKEALLQYQEKNWTITRLAQELTCTPQMAKRLVEGWLFKGIKRSPDLKVHTVIDEREEKVRLGLELYVRHQWTKQQLAEFLGYTRAFVNMILNNVAYTGVLRPESLRKGAVAAEGEAGAADGKIKNRTLTN